MKLTADLTTPWLIHLKGVLFVIIGVASGGILLWESPNLRTAALLGLTIWASCRFYYYLFYVLDRYLGRSRRFASATDGLLFLLKRCGTAKTSRDRMKNRPDFGGHASGQHYRKQKPPIKTGGA